MELFGIAFNSSYFLLIVTKNSILDVAGILDPIFITDIFAMHSWILINLKSILVSYRIQSINTNGKEDGCWLLWDGIMLISNSLRKQLLYIEKHCLSEKHVYHTLLVLRLLFLTAGNIISQSYYIEYVCCEFINVIIRVIISH